MTFRAYLRVILKGLKYLLSYFYIMNALVLWQVVTYFFYKNLTFTLTQFWFTFQTGFSGQRFYDDWFQSLYNVIFTALPVIIVGLFDKVLHSFLLLCSWHVTSATEEMTIVRGDCRLYH